MNKFNNIIKSLTYNMVDLVLPQECLGCSVSKTWLCDKCLQSIWVNPDFPCIVCRRPTWQGETHKECRRETKIDGLLVASRRSELLKDLIHSFKYENLQVLAPVLGGLLNKKLAIAPLVETLLLSSKTMFVPVPLHKSREWDRGYNQANLLAEELVKTWPATLRSDIVTRVRDTKTQTDLPKHKRLENIKGAFRVSPAALSEREQLTQEGVRGRYIFLLDDVLTTGSTLEEIAIQLKKARAKEVWALVLMRD